MSYLMVEGVAVKTPSVFDPKRFDLSAPDSGRDLSGTMHSGKLKDANGNILTKTTIDLEWNMLTPAEVKSILDAFEAQENFSVTYNDPRANAQVTKTFYIGDRSMSVKIWTLNNKRYGTVSFTIIEV